MWSKWQTGNLLNWSEDIIRYMGKTGENQTHKRVEQSKNQSSRLVGKITIKGHAHVDIHATLRWRGQYEKARSRRASLIVGLVTAMQNAKDNGPHGFEECLARSLRTYLSLSLTLRARKYLDKFAFFANRNNVPSPPVPLAWAMSTRRVPLRIWGNVFQHFMPYENS